MQHLSTVFAIASPILSVVALVWALRASIYARDCFLYVKNRNEKSETLRKLTEIEAQLTDHHDSISHLHKMLAKLRSRIGMRDLAERRAAEQVDAAPDPKQDPEGWKRYMRQQLHLQRGVKPNG